MHWMQNKQDQWNPKHTAHTTSLWCPLFINSIPTWTGSSLRKWQRIQCINLVLLGFELVAKPAMSFTSNVNEQTPNEQLQQLKEKEWRWKSPSHSGDKLEHNYKGSINWLTLPWIMVLWFSKFKLYMRLFFSFINKHIKVFLFRGQMR